MENVLASFGLPALILSLFIAMAGLWFKKTLVVYISAVTSLPAAIYFSQTSDLGLIAYLIPILFALSGWLLQKGKNKLAWLALLPMLAWLLLIIFAVVMWANFS